MSLSDKYRRALRKRAEEILRNQSAEEKSIFKWDLESLIEELNIYHIELEEQNKELQKLQENSENKNKNTRTFLTMLPMLT